MKKIFVLFAIVFLAIPVVTNAAEFKASKNVYYLNAGQVVNDNLYVAGGTVNMDGIVQKDLFSAGGTVAVNGLVGEDFATVAGNVYLNGSVKGDARVISGSLNINGKIEGELLAAGGQLNIFPNAFVGRNVYAFSGNFSDEGSVNGDLKAYGGRVYINGVISGNVMVKAKDVSLGPNAIIKGNFDYYSQNQASIASGAKIIGTLNFHQTQYASNAGFAAQFILGFITVLWLIKLLILMAGALILFFVFKRETNDLVHRATSGFWKELLRGFVLFFIIPIAIIISLITIVGIIPAFIAMLVYAIMILIGSVFAGILTGGFISKWIFRKGDYSSSWYSVILGVLVFQIIKIIPVVGWIVAGALFMVSLGVLYGELYAKFELRKK